MYEEWQVLRGTLNDMQEKKRMELIEPSTNVEIRLISEDKTKQVENLLN